MSGYGPHRRQFGRPETGDDIRYPNYMRHPSSPRSPSISSNSSWLPFYEGMPLPPPYLTEAKYMPYHHSETECPHCIDDVRRQERQFEENERMNLDVDKKARVEEEGCDEMMDKEAPEDMGEVFPEDMDLDASMSDLMKELSTQTQNNELVKIGGKRRIEEIGDEDENESPTKKTKYADRRLHSSPKKRRGIECNDESVSKKDMAAPNRWEEVRSWSNDNGEWRVQ